MVSIIVPVYNIQEYLPHCVTSLLGQTWKDVEIILVNDGSTDDSAALCNSLAASEQRLRVIHKPNGGLSSARNAGLRAARGEWILFVDGDDYLVSNAVERLMEFVEADVDFIQFRYHETPDTTWQPESDQPANTVVCTEPGQMFEKLYELGGVAASSCTKLFRAERIRTLGFAEGILHEDEELLNRLLPRCSKAVYTELELYGYVTRGGSIVHSGFKPKRMDIYPIMEARVSVLETLNLPELANETRARMFRTAAWQYCQARRGGFRLEAEMLKTRIINLAKTPEIPLSGQYSLVYKLAKWCAAAPELYYLVRRVCGKPNTL